MGRGHERWHPKYLKFVPTKEKLTDASGLGTMVEAFDSSNLALLFVETLPKRTSHRSYGSYRMGLIQISSILYGHDSLDDLEEFQDDFSLNYHHGR